MPTCREPQGPASTGLGVILGTVPSMLSQSPGRSRTTVNGRSLNPTGIQLESPGPQEPQQPRMWPLQQSARPTQECSSPLQHHHTQVRPGTGELAKERDALRVRCWPGEAEKGGLYSLKSCEVGGHQHPLEKAQGEAQFTFLCVLTVSLKCSLSGCSRAHGVLLN